MLAATHATFGNPADVLAPVDQPIPNPGPGEVRVRMVMAAIHNHDLIMVAGNYGIKPALPAIAGSEATGVVDALGEGVTHLTLGQRVMSGAVRGAWAEYFVARAETLVPLPDAIDDQQAAQLVSMPLSALLLLEFVDAKAGDWIVQNAATGAVAKVAAQAGASKGINVVSLVRRPEAVGELLALGITNVIDTSSEGWMDKARALAGPAGYKAAVDSVGGKSSGEMLSLLAEGGTLVSFGAMSNQPMQLSGGDLIFKQALVKGFWLARLMQTTPPAEIGRLIGELVTLVATGKVKLQSAGVYDLAHIADAARAAAETGRPGKVLLKP